MIDLVDPLWILKALSAVIAVALLCAYITLCIFFSHTQWQLVLHPSRTVATTPSSAGLNFTEVHFGVDATGQPQLDGWFIPTDNPTSTALILHSGDGSISAAIPAARTLHDAHLNVLLFDYRGFGHSAGQHPTQASMQSDAATALTYLTTTRSIPTSSIIIYATGAGAPIAVHLCADHPHVPALILQSPDGDFEPRVRQDPRSKLIPLSLLFNQNFPLAAPLRNLSTPKLLITTEESSGQEKLHQAADPKRIVTLGLRANENIPALITTFLNTYTHPTLTTNLYSLPLKTLDPRSSGGLQIGGGGLCR
jgi:pimeloyl-ACP methyl ester carboxylesterase